MAVLSRLTLKREPGMRPFTDETYYRPDDPAVARFWATKTLANMRAAKRGPAYVKLGGRILYEGAVLNAYLASCRVDPAAARVA